MENSIYSKKFKPMDAILLGAVSMSAFLVVALLLGIVGYIAVKGIPVINVEFLTKVESVINGTFGILGNIINTLYIIVITLLISVPIGIGAAIYLNEYAKKGKMVKAIEFATEILAGIPSIIYGLFGMVFFGNTLKLGYSILCGCFTLTLMVLPTIIRTTQEALKTVPLAYRSGAMGIGATKWYMIRTVILPSAMPGVLTGVILSIGRIVGESAALKFTSGSGYLLPNSVFKHIFNSGGSLTIQLYMLMEKASYDYAFGVALVLLIIVLAVNGLTRLVSYKK